MKRFLSQYPKLRQRMGHYAWLLLHYARALAIIVLCLWVGNLVSLALPIMIPGSIIGLLLLFFLLTFQLIPINWIKDGCNLFMRFMTVLFIPAAMGIMDTYVLLLDNFWPIILGCLGSTVLLIFIVGHLTQYLHSKNQKEQQ